MSLSPFPLEALNSSRCVVCDNYTTVAPVVLSRNGRLLKCGRCRTIRKRNFKKRVHVLEQMADHFTFPCIFSNCDQQLNFNDIKNHEKICEKRTMQCPVENCSDIVMVSSIATHFEDEHASSICYDNLNSIQFLKWKSYVILLIKNNSRFLIYLFLGPEKCCFAVFSLIHRDNTSFKFAIRIHQSNGVNLLLDEQTVKSFNEQEHCYKCMMKICYLKYHKYSSHYPRRLQPDDIMTKFSLEIICKLFELDTLTYSVTLYDENQEPRREEIKIQKFIQNCNTLRENLECPVCDKYMTSPIYICHIGHTICKTCKLRVTCCPTCRTIPFATSRVFALERIAELSEIPCHNEENGCDFIGNGTDVQEHEVDCTHDY